MKNDDPTSDRDILEQRSRLLARPRRDAEDGSAATPFAVFERAGVRFAIHPRFVFEVSRVLAPTPLPMAPAHWLGVSSLHGELLALADLAVLLDPSAARPAPAHPTRAATHAEGHAVLVLVLGTDRRELGLLVDDVHEAKPLGERLMHLPAGDPAAQLVLGSTADGIRVLRGEALLSDPRLFIQANHSSEA